MVSVFDRQEGSPSKAKGVFGRSLPLNWLKVQTKLAGTEVDLSWWELYCFCWFVLHTSLFVAAVYADSISLWTKRLFTLFVSLLVLLLRGGVLVCTNKLLIPSPLLYF